MQLAKACVPSGNYIDRLGHRIVALALAILVILPAASSGRVLAADPENKADPGAPDYVLGVEDRLSISVWRELDMVQTVVVRPDGKITFPLVGDLQAAGRTARQLDEELTQKLAVFIREPVVTVIVAEINAFKVFVLGEVVTQGALTLRRPTRLLEAIAQQGVLTPYADKSKLVILRQEDGREARIVIDYRKVLSGDRPDQNIFLKPGDTIIAN
jgi:polysaccharide export outer membrane protein